jgi:ADP-ribose pyrophosphatase
MAIAYCEEQIDVFIAEGLVPSKQNLDEDEFINVKAFSLDEITKMIFEGEMQDSKTISAIMSYRVKKGL